jgi:hypothetical protein
VKPHHYAESASLILAAQAIFVIGHRLLGHTYHGYTPGFSAALDLGNGVLWFAAASGAMLHRGFPAFALVALAVLETLLYGVMFSLASARGLGVPFMAGAGFLIVALVRSRPAWRFDERWPAPRARAPLMRARLSRSGRH